MSSGVQFALAVASGLTVSATGIAWTGRQVPYVYFTSQSAMAESASAALRIANMRTLSDGLAPCCCDTVWAMTFQMPAGVIVPVLPAQNSAIWVWSAVRVVLFEAPRLSTWLRSVAHCAELSA